jgi:hypothetical protein
MYFLLGVCAASIHPSWRRTPVYYIMIGMYVLAVLIGGCGYSPKKLTPEDVTGPVKGVIHDPTVVLVGDSTMTAWLTPDVLAANPLWTAQTSPVDFQESSTQILARLPLAIALHPDIIVLEGEVWDMAPVTPTPYLECIYETYPDQPVCTNLQSMVSEVRNAGIYCIVATLPPWGVGPLSTEIGSSPIRVDNIVAFDTWIDQQIGDSGAAIVDFHTPLSIPGPLNTAGGGVYLPAYTVDGVNPDAAGGQVMTMLAQAAIVASKVGGIR